VLGAEGRLTVFVVATERADEAAAHIAREGFGGTPVPPVDDVAIVGAPSSWSAHAQRWFDAGADSVVYCGAPDDPPLVPAGLGR
jgi:hypothetical protein